MLFPPFHILLFWRSLLNPRVGKGVVKIHQRGATYKKCSEGRFVSSLLLICSIIYLYKYGLLYIYLLLWVIIQCYVIYFITQTSPVLPSGAPLICVLSLSDMPSFASWAYLWDIARCSRLSLCFPSFTFIFDKFLYIF